MHQEYSEESPRRLIPVFPLQLVVFPTQALPLHIFEERYKQLIRECSETGMPFGIPAAIEGKLAEYGTLVRLVKILNEYPDGRMDILTEGLQAFRLQRYIREAEDKLYSAGEVALVENDATAYAITREELVEQYKRLHEILKSGTHRSEFDMQNLSFSIGHEVGFDLIQKLELLSVPKESDRQLMIVNHLHRIIPVLKAVEETKDIIQGNGHVRRLPRLDV